MIAGTVQDILQRKGSTTWTIAPEATVYEAIQMMADKNVGALLVMANEQLMGVVSERDYTRKVALKGKASRETQVGEIVTHRPTTVSPTQSVQECLELMTDKRVRHLPVLAEGKVVGIVSIGDLVSWIISAQRVQISQLESYIAGQYPG
jgi:CBS domain-containing protein